MNKAKKIKILNNKGYYFPLFNMKGLVSSITPYFAGDLKKGYYNYALKPATETDLFNLTNQRNVYFFVDGVRYDLNGQLSHQQDDDLEYSIEKLAQRVVRTNDKFKINSLSFVPVDETLEVHQIEFINTSDKVVELEVITAFPFYSRSPENIFDHRHVTSLLNDVKVLENGIVNKPTLSFDERGHKENLVNYSFFAFSDKTKAVKYLPVLDEFINGGTNLYPKGLFEKGYQVGDTIKGYEAMGAIGFNKVIVKPNEPISFTLLMGIHEDYNLMLEEVNKYKDTNYLEKAYDKTINYFDEINSYIKFELNSSERIEQLNWVTLQPILRRHLGNSYMPHHDYGKGGRGWRDLWQDLLALIFSNDKTVKESIVGNFAGVRIDGSNATIIGSLPFEFKADRNKIVRVWSDHGAWPLLTVKLYIDETGDKDIIFTNQKYFDDQFTHYTKQTKVDVSSNNVLKIEKEEYLGTILEHLLLQNIVGYFNVGKNGFTKLEDADWNDGLDMANKLGETVPFTMFYLNNIRVIVDILKNVDDNDIEVFNALKSLIFEEYTLNEYFNVVADYKGLNKVKINKDVLIEKLETLIEVKETFILKNAVINDSHYKSYVNNDGKFLEDGKKISLTAQAMALMNNVPSKELALNVAAFTKNELFDANIGGYRLNSNYEKVLTNMGRAYGFAYGHKENGAVFCHMATMYTYGLYNYNLVDYGFESINALLDQALNPDSNVLVGVPEYFNNEGVGKYPFLTGTASWLIKLLREQVFGINFNYGVLSFNPKLAKKDFINGVASIKTYLFGKLRTVKYINDKNLEYGNYKISKIFVNKVEVNKNEFNSLDGDVEVYLNEVN